MAGMAVRKQKGVHVMRKTYTTPNIRIVISEGENDYYVFASQEKAEQYAKQQAAAQHGTHWIVFKEVCGYAERGDG